MVDNKYRKHKAMKQLLLTLNAAKGGEKRTSRSQSVNSK